MNYKSTTSKLLIADGNCIIRFGLKKLLTKSLFSEINEVNNCLDLISKTTNYQYTHIIVDYFLEQGDVLKILQDIRQKNKNVSIMLYAESENNKLNFDSYVTSGLINIFVDKNAPFAFLKKQLNIFSKDFNNDELVNSSINPVTNPFLTLSNRQQLVVKYLLMGLTINDIANKMNIKSNTVSTMKSIAFDKVSVNSIVDLIHLSSEYKF